MIDEKGWTPCSERLPNETGYYLVTVKSEEGKIVGAHYWDEDADADEYDCEHEVIAWMPLPEPYKRGQGL